MHSTAHPADKKLQGEFRRYSKAGGYLWLCHTRFEIHQPVHSLNINISIHWDHATSERSSFDDMISTISTSKEPNIKRASMRKPPRCDEGRALINVSSSSLVDPLKLWVNPAAAAGSPLMPNMCNNSRVGLDCPRTTTLKASVRAKIETRSLSDNCSIAGEVRSESAAHFRTFEDKDPCDLLTVAAPAPTCLQQQL